MLKLAVPKIKKLNPDKNLLNVKNGMLNIDNFELIEHGPKYFSANQLPVAYDENAKCERFLTFLEEIMEKDAERIYVLQELLVPHNI